MCIDSSRFGVRRELTIQIVLVLVVARAQAGSTGTGFGNRKARGGARFRGIPATGT